MTFAIPGSAAVSMPQAELQAEVAAEFEAERGREAVRRDAWLDARRALGGVGDVIPEKFSPASDAEVAARAQAAVDRRAAFRASPEGRFATALGEIERVLGHAFAALDQARAARARNFTGERDLCRRKADELFALSRRFRAAALDASLATDY